MMWPLKWKLSAFTYTWCNLFFKISQNEIRKFGRNLLLAKFGNERVNEGHVLTDFGLKTKVSEIQREKKLLRTLSQVYKFGLYRYCKSSFLIITKQKKKRIYLEDWKFLEHYI